MKVLIRGLNVIDNRAKFINTVGIDDIRALKLYIKANYQAFRKARFYLTKEGKKVCNEDHIEGSLLSEYQVRFCMVGGKGGFGSLLKRQPPVKKRTNNFDSCRDLAGRRLRHVNQEKMLMEYQKKKEEEEKILKQYEQGDENMKEKLYSLKKEETEKLSLKFYKEQTSVTQSISNSIKFLLKKRNKAKNGLKEEVKEVNNIDRCNNIEIPIAKKKAEKKRKTKNEKKEEYDVENELFAIDY
jgi:hypothetical protein